VGNPCDFRAWPFLTAHGDKFVAVYLSVGFSGGQISSYRRTGAITISFVRDMPRSQIPGNEVPPTEAVGMT
jgi:hypothetical protein